TWGDAAKLRFTFEDSKEGRAAMEDFQKTGVLPGAMSEQNPMKARFDALAAKGMAKLSPTEKAELQTIAESANAAMLLSDPTSEEFKSVPGVKFDQHKKGKHSSTEMHAGFLGLNFLSTQSSSSSEVMRYAEDGEQLIHYRDGFERGHLFDQPDVGIVDVNRPGSNELQLDARLDLADDDERKRIYALDGKGMPDWSIFGGYDGDKDRITFNLAKSDIPILAEHGSDLPFFSASRHFSSALHTRESLKNDLASPVDQGQVAHRMLQQQVREQMMSEPAALSVQPQGAQRFPMLQPFQNDLTPAFLPPRLDSGMGMRTDPISMIQQRNDPFGTLGFTQQLESQRRIQQAFDDEVGRRVIEQTAAIEQAGGMEKWLGEQSPDAVMETVRGIRAEQIQKYAAIMQGEGSNPHLEQLAEVVNGQDFRSLPTELQEMYFREVPGFGQNQVNLLRTDKVKRDAFIYRQLNGGDPTKIVRFVEDLKPGERDSPVIREWYRRNLTVGRH
ncbi:MAG: hypothetical protein H6737_28845, partial [Alphaproteobacteria bacterium]|nr:hypothetical protein [Alphaproteobacteria bacterium]